MRRLLAPIIAVALALTLQPQPAAAYGGPSNIVIATNQTDGHLVVQGRVHLVRMPGPIQAPQNLALARATTCTGCRTLAVALQLDLVARGARYVAPQNVAVATNAACDGCITLAKAVQVVIPVDDPTQIPPELADAMHAFDREMVSIASDQTISIADADARTDALIARFLAIAIGYDTQRQTAQ